MRWLLTVLAIGLMLAVRTTPAAAASSPQYIPGYPLYCQGPLTTSAASGNQTSTPFVWAPTGAGAASPAAGQCSWADRPGRDVEVLPGGGNVICDFSGAMQSVPAGTFVEVGVARDPLVNNCMHLVRYIGTVSPPFSPIPALAPFVRQSIAALTPAQIASLRHGIQVMMSRGSSDPTSFAFQANIHGTYTAPSTPEETQSWNNCEHGSYYFLSWHRMYLYFFDRILRAAAGDPNLALPYWNWTDPGQRNLPLAFRQPADPSNSLYIATPRRPQGVNDGTSYLGAGTVDYSVAFADTDFDSPTGSGASFGGQIASSPMQFNYPHGDFEGQPHDVVHVALAGLMGDPDTAAEDPIFWLHHNNIDRMWNRWIGQGGRVDATDANWLNTQFTFYDEAGHAVYLTGAEIVDSVGQLNYRFDDDPLRLRWRFPITTVTAIGLLRPTPPPPPPFVPPGLVRVGAAQAAPGELRAEEKAAAPQLRPLAESAPAGKEQRTELAGAAKHLSLPLSEQALSRLRELSERPAPREVFLRFDDIRYEKSNGVYYEVYLNPSPNEKLDIQSPAFVGNLALFGLKPHAMPGQPAASAKNVFVDYDISHLVRAALTAHPKSWTVVLLPRGLFDAKGEPLPVPKETQGTVGRVQILTR